MNLETEEEREIRAGADQYLRAVGFINDDFIYGLANIPDIQVLPAGNVLFAMKELKIESFSGELVKDYNPANCWVTNVTITEGLVEMSRVTMTEYGYLPAPTDNIMNNRQVAKSEIGVAVAVTGRHFYEIAVLLEQIVLSPVAAVVLGVERRISALLRLCLRRPAESYDGSRQCDHDCRFDGRRCGEQRRTVYL